MQAVMEEARSQQAVTVTELDWLGSKMPVNNANTRMCILKGWFYDTL
jgi:signal recognition particle subunit SRP68